MPCLKTFTDGSGSFAFVFFAASLERAQTVGDKHLHSGQIFNGAGFHEVLEDVSKFWRYKTFCSAWNVMVDAGNLLQLE